ncbi:hypothetical protein NBH00_21825 [Paraconexibacter antarcticus]|uniref:GAF domain-containing protein n=1 Tax=Paraconexibacter antarcticus TaxID=2949664 RepID=A0ABY5DSA9_9ACTN|nr:hypothetical protein [Paraconexibacter antarcticus]UTI63967.1 hypothetical protein NBH00_21825 [Paraconexibacter antarcticus]
MSTIEQTPRLVGWRSVATGGGRNVARTHEPRVAAIDLGPAATADPHRLRPLERRLTRAATVADIYNLALGSARRRPSVRCAFVVSVDCERLSLPSGGDSPTSAAASEVAEHLAHQPYELSADDLRAIDDSDGGAADRALERIVIARLGLPLVAVGRIKLDRSTVALLVADHQATPTESDRTATAEIAALIGLALQRSFDDFWRRVAE